MSSLMSEAHERRYDGRRESKQRNLRASEKTRSRGEHCSKKTKRSHSDEDERSRRKHTSTGLGSSSSSPSTRHRLSAKSAGTRDDSRNKEPLPRSLLESISNQVLDYTKQVGFFDELRVKLLQEIELHQDFASIQEEFQRQVGDFCQHEADLELSRSKLREQLNERCESGRFKSTQRLDKTIQYVMQKYKKQLMQQYLATTNNCPELQQLKSRAREHVLPTLAPIASPQTPMLVPVKTTPPPLGREESPRRIRLTTTILERQREKSTLRNEESTRLTLKSTSKHQPPEVSHIPTPSPSISPPRTPPTPVKRSPSLSANIATLKLPLCKRSPDSSRRECRRLCSPVSSNFRDSQSSQQRGPSSSNIDINNKLKNKKKNKKKRKKNQRRKDRRRANVARNRGQSPNDIERRRHCEPAIIIKRMLPSTGSKQLDCGSETRPAISAPASLALVK